MPHAEDFALVSCQASLFTPEAEVSTGRFMTRVLPNWAARFDADPISFPLPEGLPKDVPRLMLQSTNQQWRCEIASGRTNFFWRNQTEDRGGMTAREFFTTVMPLLFDYRQFIDSPIRRLAAVLNRYALRPAPGRYLAEHFCRDRWLEAPFNRPESFELHAHKVFDLADGLRVNSWVRNKTAKFAASQHEIVLVEQDLNTLEEEVRVRDFSTADIQRFFETSSAEFDRILQLYFPGDID